jgi:hypothetical protein
LAHKHFDGVGIRLIGYTPVHPVGSQERNKNNIKNIT